MKTPLNRKTIQQHFQYSWWMYVLAAVLCVFVWDMAYIMSAPRTPEELKLELYIYGYGDSANVDAYLDRVHAEELPDMVEVTAMYLLPDETSGLMVLATRLMAGEGDLFLLPRDSFQSYAAQGVFTALEQMDGIQEMCEDAGINRTRLAQESGYRRAPPLRPSRFFHDRPFHRYQHMDVRHQRDVPVRQGTERQR